MTMAQRCALRLDTFQQVLVMWIQVLHVQMVHVRFYEHAFDTVHVVLQHPYLQSCAVTGLGKRRLYAQTSSLSPQVQSNC